MIHKIGLDLPCHKKSPGDYDDDDDGNDEDNDRDTSDNDDHDDTVKTAEEVLSQK